MTPKPENLPCPVLTIPMKVVSKGNNPAIELRKVILDVELIRALVEACLEDKPLLVFPVSRTKLVLTNSLLAKGIMSRNKSGKLEFNF